MTGDQFNHACALRGQISALEESIRNVEHAKDLVLTPWPVHLSEDVNRRIRELALNDLQLSLENARAEFARL